jgi:hypothetical protein
MVSPADGRLSTHSSQSRLEKRTFNAPLSGSGARSAELSAPTAG